MTSIWRHIPTPFRRLIGLMIAMQGLLSAGYLLHLADAPGTRQFNMDSELNLPTWWSATLLIVAGAAALLLSRVNGVWRRPVVPWLLVGVGLLLISAEEIAGIHEDVGVAVGGGTENVSVWPLVYAPFAIAGVWLLLRAVRDLPRPLAIVGIAGLVAYVCVLGMEVVALAAESSATILIEENLEMLGTGLMLVAVGSALHTRAAPLFVHPDTAEPVLGVPQAAEPVPARAGAGPTRGY